MRYQKYSVIYVFLFSFFFTQVKAQQNSITLSPYNQSDVGMFMSAEYSRKLKNDVSLNVGLLFHLNIDSRNPDRNQELYLHGRFWAYNYREGIGITMGVQKNIFYFSNKKIRFFAFEQTMLRYMGAKSQRYKAIDTVAFFDSAQNKTLYIEHSQLITTNIRNLISVENILGIGLSADISKKFSFNVKFGVGVNAIFNTPEEYLNTNIVLEYSLLQSFGILYKF